MQRYTVKYSGSIAHGKARFVEVIQVETSSEAAQN